MTKVIACCFAIAVAFVHCALAADLPHYVPQQRVDGEIRVWGSPEDAQLLKLWDEGFRKYQPAARVVPTLRGPESTLAGIYTGRADIAFIGRELRVPLENMAFKWVKLYSPTTIEVANASLTSDRLAGNIGLFVHPDNPLHGLTIAQLDGVFGAEHKRGVGNLRTWDDLGLTGEWRKRPIHVFAPPVDSIASLFFRRAVLGDSFKWSTTLKEFPTDAEAIAAVARDPLAIAYGRMGVASDGVKLLPLAAQAGAPFVPLTAATAADRSYPLARTVIVALDRKPGTALDPKVREFMRYVLSAEGQEAVARDGVYIPLDATSVTEQLKRLD